VIRNGLSRSENVLSGNAGAGLDMGKCGGYMPAQAGFSGPVGD
jgi:hypothetical protein